MGLVYVFVAASISSKFCKWQTTDIEIVRLKLIAYSQQQRQKQLQQQRQKQLQQQQQRQQLQQQQRQQWQQRQRQQQLQ